MPTPKPTLVAFELRTGSCKKVVKIAPYGDGGFAVLTPYHAERQGYLAKIPVDYAKVELEIALADAQAFTAEDRVKLSYHPDGFVQFSAERGGRIISGRDPETGAARGVAVFTKSLVDPIRTGPSFALTVWGLDAFHDRASVRANDIVFSDDDMYFRGCTEDDATGWVIEGFVFPRSMWAGVRRRNGALLLSLSFIRFEAAFAVIDLKVLDVPGQPYFIGLFASRVDAQFETPSGWVLSGPSERGPSGQTHMLIAHYPRHPRTLMGASSLDRNTTPERGA